MQIEDTTFMEFYAQHEHSTVQTPELEVTLTIQRMGPTVYAVLVRFGSAAKLI